MANKGSNTRHHKKCAHTPIANCIIFYLLKTRNGNEPDFLDSTHMTLFLRFLSYNIFQEFNLFYNDRKRNLRYHSRECTVYHQNKIVRSYLD